GGPGRSAAAACPRAWRSPASPRRIIWISATRASSARRTARFSNCCSEVRPRRRTRRRQEAATTSTSSRERQMLKKYGFQGAATLAILTAAGSAAWAQTEQRISGLEEIVVTAERREGNLQTVPIAVSALTPSTLENIQIGSSQDLQKIIPGLRMVDGIATPTNFTIALRGSIQQDSSVIVVESPVGIYVDDVYIPRLNGANSQLLDIERVEVLRGPQGTLYGRNTLSGALKFVTRTPGEESWLQLRAGYGSYNRVEVGG